MRNLSAPVKPFTSIFSLRAFFCDWKPAEDIKIYVHTYVHMYERRNRLKVLFKTPNRLVSSSLVFNFLIHLIISFTIINNFIQFFYLISLKLLNIY